MKELERRRRIHLLGERAITYYVETGLCVFCGADDVTGAPHEECDVGVLSQVTLTPLRAAEMQRQRRLIYEALGGDGAPFRNPGGFEP